MQELFKLYSSEDYLSAEKRVNLLLTQYKEAPVLLYVKGCVCFALKKYSLAKECFHSLAKRWASKSMENQTIISRLRPLELVEKFNTRYKQALQTSADSSEALFQLGNILIKLEHFDDAHDCFSAIVKQYPKHYLAYNNLGVSLKDSNRIKEAINVFLKALAIKPDFLSSLTNLTSCYRIINDFDNSIKICRRLSEIDPLNCYHYLFLTKMTSFSSIDEDMLRMEKLYEHPNTTDSNKCYLAFSLAKAYDDLQEYDQSFQWLVAANQLKRTSNYSIEANKKLLSSFKDYFDKDFFLQNKDVGVKDVSPLFILGLPRSGTTLTEQILSSHPEVYGAGEITSLGQVYLTSEIQPRIHRADKEKNFDKNYIEKLSRNYLKIIEQYATGYKFISNKTPANFQLIGFIKLLFPNAKIIHCKRNPLDNCLSLYKNYFDFGNEYSYDLKEVGEFYNIYNDLMNHWHEVLPAFIYDSQYENLVGDSKSHVAALLDYCDLSWDDACMEFYKNKRPVDTLSLTQVRRPFYSDSINLWKKYEKFLHPLIDVLEK